MANRRRQAASVTGTEKLVLTSPARRSNRRRAAVESAQCGESPCSENRAEERSLYKTPKRTQVSRSRLPTFNSPTNEIDMQQEIFWDPQSPTTYKLGNSQKKLTVGGHTVEISDIVNRIAPQDEKPACCEGSLLGLWIGEDAIPCTPGITNVRSRTKINMARVHQLKHGEEELMKLAKQFDKNLIDAVQEKNFLQPNSIHVSSAAKLSTEHHIKVQREDQWQLMNEHPAINSTLSHGILKENAEIAKSPKSSSQKSIDLDAEGALNDLFDCSTQKCSGQLSQGVLNCSSISVVQCKGTFLEAEQPLVSDKPQGQSAMHLKQYSEFFLTEKSKTTSVQTFSNVELSNNNPDNTFSDDSYDWNADLLPDDSLLMQITQEPELMKRAEDACISEEKGELQKWTVNSKKPSIAQAGVFHSSSTIPVSCVSMSKQIIQSEKAKIIPFHKDSSLKTNKVDWFSKTRQNNTLDYNFTSVKSENRNVPHGPSHLKNATNTSSEKRTSISYSDLAKLSTGKFKNHVHGTSYKASVVPTNKNCHDLKTTINQGSSDCPQQTSMAKKGMFSFDDWSEPKFSDEVLELFCESNTSWGTHCNDDDDDDLLYQVCDDVERKTQSQMGTKETGKAKSMAKSASNLEQSLCQSGPSQGLSICLQTEKNSGRKTFSLDPPIATRKNENSTNMSTVYQGSFASGTGRATMSSVKININNRQWQNGHDVRKIKTNCNQLSSEKSKYIFKKASSSQALVLDHKNVNVGSLSGTNKGLWESKNAPNIPFQKVMNGKPVVKSTDFAASEKEYKSRRCSQEEIARKKQEALERRKCKMEALCKNAAPT